MLSLRAFLRVPLPLPPPFLPAPPPLVIAKRRIEARFSLLRNAVRKRRRAKDGHPRGGERGVGGTSSVKQFHYVGSITRDHLLLRRV